MKCTKCDEQDIKQFSKDKNSAIGYAWHCKSCQSNKAKKWYQKNKSRQHDLARQPHMRYLYAKKRSKHRDLDWSIAEEQYLELIQLQCYYCGILPTKETTGYWLDRIDNKLGYHTYNVVPCCGSCNVGRGDNFSMIEWQVAINAIKQLRMVTPTGVEPVSPG